MKIQGTIRPLSDKVIITDMEFGNELTASGIIIPSDNGKTQGIHPRWGKVWAIGPEQEDVEVGDWICVEHGRWSRGSEIELEDGTKLEIRLVDTKSILLVSKDKPSDIHRSIA